MPQYNKSMSVKQMRDFWTRFSPETTPATTPINDKFWEYFSPGDHILEVGVAWGRIVYECLKRDLRVTGIDINPQEISHLEDRLKRKGLNNKVKLYVESVTKMHFRSGSFDGIFLQGLLSALSLEKRSKAMKEVYRVLKPKGYVHISEFELNENDPIISERYKKDLKITGEYGTVSVTDKNGNELFRSHNFSRQELTKLVKGVNLEPVDITKSLFSTFKNKLKHGIMLIAQKK